MLVAQESRPVTASCVATQTATGEPLAAFCCEQVLRQRLRTVRGWKASVWNKKDTNNFSAFFLVMHLCFSCISVYVTASVGLNLNRFEGLVAPASRR